jgi:hypothetical protein
VREPCQNFETREFEGRRVRLTHIPDTQNHDIPFRIGMWSQGMIMWNILALITCASGWKFAKTYGLFLKGSSRESKTFSIQY